MVAPTTARSRTATRLGSRKFLPRSTSHSIDPARGTRPRRLRLLPRELTLGRSSPTRSQRRQQMGSVGLPSPRLDHSRCPCPSVWSRSLLNRSHHQSRRSRRGSRIRTQQLSWLRTFHHLPNKLRRATYLDQTTRRLVYHQTFLRRTRKAPTPPASLDSSCPRFHLFLGATTRISLAEEEGQGWRAKCLQCQWESPRQGGQHLFQSRGRRTENSHRSSPLGSTATPGQSNRSSLSRQTRTASSHTGLEG